MLDLLITRNKLEARLRKMDKAHKALEEASLDLDPSTKIRIKELEKGWWKIYKKLNTTFNQ